MRLVTIGRKAVAYFRFRGREVTESFIGFHLTGPTFADARAVAAPVVAAVPRRRG